ncbi:MAG: type II toxin-antitoxin system VapC family toxin [Microscillaceae bacterium]|nr:type II toxin-antitoxin system VapC family toxin [Microscillaceae bacterium]
MRYLLDTHTLIWYLELDDNLSKTAKETIENNDNLILVSIVSLWEIAIKSSIGKLGFDSFFENIDTELSAQDIGVLPIGVNDIKIVRYLPFLETAKHKDPFDRLLVAQAKYNDLTIITKDDMFKHYDVMLLW